MKNRIKMDSHIVIAIMWGILSALIFTLLLSAIASSVIQSGKASESITGWLSSAVWAISVFCGAMLSLKLHSEQIWIVSGAIGIGYILLLCAVNILFFEQSFAGIGRGLLSILAGLTIAVLLKVRGQKSNRKKTKYRPR